MRDIKESKISSRPIGVFDSGVGGLSVLQELNKILPNENFIFLADQKYVPYGEKSKSELIRLVFKITDYFVKNHDVKMMVVACNTATCAAIKELRQQYTVPIVGTVPAIKVAAGKTKSGAVAVIATPSTSKSSALKKLILDNCKGVKVLNIGCQNLEDVVEKGELNSKKVHDLLSKYLKQVKDSNTDQLVLGCTHYSFLKKNIGKILGNNVDLVDGNIAIAKRVKSLVAIHKLQNAIKKRGRIAYFTTRDVGKFSKVASILLKKKVKAVKVKL